MKFSIAWANIASQNVTLKAAVAVLGISTLGLAVTSAKLALKPPIIIERACFSRSVAVSQSPQRSPSEIEAFVKDAVSQRFDSDVSVVPGTLSSQEEAQRMSEQRELSSRGMTQRVVVNSVRIAGDAVMVDSDRLISVGTIRSAFPFPLSLGLSSLGRNEANPYGLILQKVSQTKEEGKK